MKAEKICVCVFFFITKNRFVEEREEFLLDEDVRVRGFYSRLVWVHRYCLEE